MVEDTQCSFCHRHHYEVLNLIASPEDGIYICSQCVEEFYPTPPEHLLHKYSSKKKNSPNSLLKTIHNFFNSEHPLNDPICSFCNHNYPQPQFLITNSNDTAFICNRCMEVCKNVIEERTKDLRNFISHWQQELKSSQTSDNFSYPKQKHLLEKIEYWVDFKPSDAQNFLPLLDMMLKQPEISKKITKRIELIKSEILEIDE